MIGQFKACFYSDDIHINTVNCYFLNVSIVPTIRNCDVISILIPLNYVCLLTNKSFNASVQSHQTQELITLFILLHKLFAK